MVWISEPESWIALVTLVALELVLGVDNIIFISILSGKLSPAVQPRARTIGIILAVFTRILLLTFLSWIIRLDEPFFVLPVFKVDITGKSLVLLVGGLFLLWKSTREIHDKLEGQEGHASNKVAATFTSVVFQIMLLDIVFSLDSVITAVGMANEIAIMIIAVIIAAGIMIFVAGFIGDFVERHPTIKMLALSFLLLIGFTLVAGSFGVEISKGYVYFAMGFSVFVEVLNLRVRSRVKPVNLREAYMAERSMELPPVPAGVEAGSLVTRRAAKPTRKPAPKPKNKPVSKPKKKL
jgi:predicted tellurium resistance membrane protein TerC